MNRINAGDVISAAELDANFQEALSLIFAIGDPNIIPGVSGAKIAANSMPGDRLVLGSVGLSQMGAGAIGTTQLVDLAVTKAKLSTTVGQRITKAQTELKSFAGTAGFSIGGSRLGVTFMAAIGQQVVSGTNSWVVRVTQAYFNTGTGTWIVGDCVNTVVVAPGAAIPVASTTPLGLILDSPVFATGGGQVNFTLYYIENGP